MNLTQKYVTTLYNWLSKFTTIYREPVQFDADNPQPNEYITYSAVVNNFAEQFIQPITIYSKSTSYKYVWEIADAIESDISERGIVIRDEWGYLKIEKGNPFYQDNSDEDTSIRAGYVNLQITIYQKNV